MKPSLLSIIEYLARLDAPAEFAAIARSTAIPPATLTRHLARLTNCGYACRVAHGVYCAGPALTSLGLSVTMHAGAGSYRPLLIELANQTGYNAELYALTAEGPMFLMAVPGKSELRTNLAPGYVVKQVFTHPMGALFFHQFPRVLERRLPEAVERGFSEEQVRDWIRRALRDRFLIDRAGIRPELTRAAVPSTDGTVCVCVSGFTSDFPQDRDDSLRGTMLEALRRFEEQGATG